MKQVQKKDILGAEVWSHRSRQQPHLMMLYELGWQWAVKHHFNLCILHFNLYMFSTVRNYTGSCTWIIDIYITHHHMHASI